jgi:hypothetical protein
VQIAEAFESFVAEPVRRGRADLAIYRLSQLLHDRTNGKSDRVFMKVASRLKPKQTLPESANLSKAERDEVVAALRRDGYRVLPFRLAERDIAEIRSFAFSTPAFGNSLTQRQSVSPGQIPPEIPRFTWPMGELAGLPAIKRIVLAGPYCEIAQEYLGCRPVLAHVSLWLDAPCKDRFEPYLYHYDNEGPGFLKFFFFLSDVEVGTGAHHFVAGSHRPGKPDLVSRAGLYSDEQIFAAYSKQDEMIAQGSAGTILVEDTKGFHRGSHITRDFRLLVQLEFSVIDVPTEQELATPWAPLPIVGLDPAIASIARKFYSRS